MNPAAYWQQELMRENIYLRRWLDKAGLEKAVQLSVSIERHVFVTAYIMRKLREASVLTEEVITSNWPVTKYLMTAPGARRRGCSRRDDVDRHERVAEAESRDPAAGASR